MDRDAVAIRAHWRAPGFWMLAAVTAAVWLVTLTRIVPGAWGDHGTFVSVAERLIRGDRLYIDVWDNKDPLFYYLLALARSVTDAGDVLLEVGWLLAAATSVWFVARAAGLRARRAGFVSWIAAPIILTGSSYEPGMTHLPGIAACLAIQALALRRRWMATGAVIAILAFLKITMLPVALAVVAATWLTTRERQALWRLPLTAVTTAGGIATAMASRGEWGGYLSTQRMNVGYSNSGLIESDWGPLVGHLLRVVPVDLHSQALVTTVATCLLLFAGTVRQATGPSGSLHALVWGGWSSLAAAIGVLALTGMWVHHAQVLYVPGILATILISLRAQEIFGAGWRQGAGLVLAAVLVAGVVHPFTYLTSVRSAKPALVSLTGPSDEARSLEGIRPGRLARLGTNDTDAFARGLSTWELGCARFTQYPFDPSSSFDEAVDCLASVDAVVVMKSYQPDPQEARWSDFVTRARSVLDSEFACRAEAYGQLCLRRGTA